jgi:hypothetical protein
MQEYAQPFVDSPSDVIKHLLDFYESEKQKEPSATSPEANSQMATSGAVNARTFGHLIERSGTGAISEQTLQNLLLIALLQHGGSAKTATAVRTVHRMLEDLDALHQVDLEISSKRNQWERWETNTRFARKHLVDSSYLRDDSSRGWWELSGTGRERAEMLNARFEV